MSADRGAIDWTDVYDRLKKSRLSLAQASTPTEEELRAVYRRRATRLAGRQSRTVAAALSVLAFRVGRERYGLRLEDLAEVVPFAGCTPLPGAPPELEGVVNLRGDIYLVVDLGRLLGLSGDAADGPGHILFLRREGRKIGVKVSRVDRSRPIFPDELIAPEEKKQHLSTRYVKSLTQDGLIVMDLDALLSHPVFQEAGRP